MCAASIAEGATGWQAVNLSLYAFTVEPQTNFEVTWWQDLTGSDDFESTKRKIERIDDGEYHDHGLKLQMNPLQIVWLSGPLMSRVTASEGPVTVGSFNSARDDFLELMDRWLKLPLVPMKRLSFVGQLLLMTATKEEAYAKLDKYLPSVEVDPSSSDFQYRINRKRKSKIGEWEINRLTTWGALEFKAAVGIVTAGAASVTELPSRGFASALHFDVNTVADRTEPFPGATLPALFRELVDLATDITVNGDVP